MTDKTPKTRGLHELYAEDPAAADLKLWGREVDPHSRRGFLKRSSLLAMAAAVAQRIALAAEQSIQKERALTLD